MVSLVSRLLVGPTESLGETNRWYTRRLTETLSVSQSHTQCTHRLTDWLAPSIKLLPWWWSQLTCTLIIISLPLCKYLVLNQSAASCVNVDSITVLSQQSTACWKKRKFKQRGCMLALDKWRLTSNLGTGHIVLTVQLHSSVQSCCVQLELATWLPRQHISCSSLVLPW